MVALKQTGLFRRAAAIVAEAGVRWVSDGCYRMGASLAFYALFSLFPLLLVAVAVVGFLLGGDPASRGRLVASAASFFSAPSRALLDDTLLSLETHRTARGVGALVGTVTLIFGASGVFSELQASLNTIWRVKVDPSRAFRTTVVRALEDQALSFAAVAVAGVVLLASLFISTVLSVLDGIVPSALVWHGLEALVSFGLTTILFAIVFRILPRTTVAWRDVLGGALFTALLFSVLKHLLAWYLGSIGSYAAYGAVGAVLGLLMWIYLVSLLVFFGAELTRVYAEREGSLT